MGELLGAFGASVGMLLELCKARRFPDLCMMLVNYVDDCSMDTYSGLIDFAFSTYSIDLVERIAEKMADSQLRLSQYRYGMTRVGLYYPVLYFVVSNLDACVDVDELPADGNPTEIARELVNMIDFKHARNQQFINFTYNGPVKADEQGAPIVRARCIKKMPYWAVSACVGRAGRVCGALQEALRLLGFE